MEIIEFIDCALKYRLERPPVINPDVTSHIDCRSDATVGHHNFSLSKYNRRCDVTFFQYPMNIQSSAESRNRNR